MNTYFVSFIYQDWVLGVGILDKFENIILEFKSDILCKEDLIDLEIAIKKQLNKNVNIPIKIINFKKLK